jgi:hypothetical protein
MIFPKSTDKMIDKSGEYIYCNTSEKSKTGLLNT